MMRNKKSRNDFLHQKKSGQISRREKLGNSESLRLTVSPFNYSWLNLSTFLFMSVFTQALFAFMSVHFFALSFFT